MHFGPVAHILGMLLMFAHLPLLGKWVLAALMLMGRLEIYTAIVLLSPGAWRK